MSVGRVEIDSDESGWLVAFDGDLTDAVENYLSGRVDTRLILRLPDDQAVALLEEVKQKIRPWHVEGESVRHDHERYRRTGELPDYVSEDRPDWCPPTPGRQEGDASTSPSELTEAERREAIRYGRSPMLGEGPPHDVVDGEFEEEAQAELEAAFDRADYERKRDRENR